MLAFDEQLLNYYLYGYNDVRLATAKEVEGEINRVALALQTYKDNGLEREHESLRQQVPPLWHLPKEISLCVSGIPGASFGVCTVQPLEVGTWFGPFEGRITQRGEKQDANKSEHMWEVFGDSRVSHFLDGYNSVSWMSYVRCARHQREQNLAVFQYQGNIYYRSICDIPPGKELLVWYDDSYLQMLGLPIGIVDAKTNEEKIRRNLSRGASHRQVQQQHQTPRSFHDNFPSENPAYMRSKKSSMEMDNQRMHMIGQSNDIHSRNVNQFNQPLHVNQMHNKRSEERFIMPAVPASRETQNFTKHETRERMFSNEINHNNFNNDQNQELFGSRLKAIHLRHQLLEKSSHPMPIISNVVSRYHSM